MVFGYLTHKRSGDGSGMRVQDDGTVELNLRGDWTPIATLGDDALVELRDEVRASGVLELPERTERPQNVHDGDAAEPRAGDDAQPPGECGAGSGLAIGALSACTPCGQSAHLTSRRGLRMPTRPSTPPRPTSAAATPMPTW